MEQFYRPYCPSCPSPNEQHQNNEGNSKQLNISGNLRAQTSTNNVHISDDAVSVPCAPLHEVTGVGEGVDEQEERVPETSTGVHADEVEAPVHTYVIDDCSTVAFSTSNNSKEIKHLQNKHATTTKKAHLHVCVSDNQQDDKITIMSGRFVTCG